MKSTGTIKIGVNIATKSLKRLEPNTKLGREQSIILNLSKNKHFVDPVNVDKLEIFNSPNGYTTYKQKRPDGMFVIGFDEYSNPIKSVEKYKQKVMPSMTLEGHSPLVDWIKPKLLSVKSFLIQSGIVKAETENATAIKKFIF